MKSTTQLPSYVDDVVAPYAGAWIEIRMDEIACGVLDVAPYAGAWIEISALIIDVQLDDVAPYAGAWIEIGRWVCAENHGCSRSLRGSVD